MQMSQMPAGRRDVPEQQDGSPGPSDTGLPGSTEDGKPSVEPVYRLVGKALTAAADRLERVGHQRPDMCDHEPETGAAACAACACTQAVDALGASERARDVLAMVARSYAEDAAYSAGRVSLTVLEGSARPDQVVSVLRLAAHRVDRDMGLL